MKTLIIYSSLSGNTKYLAEGIFKGIEGPKDIVSVDDNPKWQDYDNILVGYWVTRGGPDEKAEKILKEIKDKRVGVFATLGAYPWGEHAHKSIQTGIDLVKDNNEIIGRFICQGRLSEDIMKRLSKLEPGDPHYPDEKRKKRWEYASSHPDENDIADALRVFAGE